MFGSIVRRSCICLALICVGNVWAMPDIQVQGLFTGRAMVSIDGNVKLMREGETSPEGVLLVSADSKAAVIEYEGVSHTLSLSDRIGASFAQPEAAEVRLQPDSRGHYLARASINGRFINVMVDTGATMVAMNSRHAAELGLNLDNASRSRASTASGIVETKLVTLSSVSIGGVTRNAVAASVIEGDFPETILLGNSFLSGVDMRVESGILILKPKF